MKDQNPNDSPYTPSHYSKAYQQYNKTQAKLVFPFLNSISKNCEYGSQFPVCKVLKAVSRFFLLNEIQVIFLGYIIRETNWNIKERIISSNAQSIQDLVCCGSQSSDYKRIILYLMIAAFTVKYYLNKNANQQLQQASKKCPNFKQIFENWAKKYSSVATKINPRTLNIVYKQLYTDTRKQNRNYNVIVDSILQISPAYNPDKERVKKQDKKKPQIESDIFISKDNIMLKNEKNSSAQPLININMLKKSLKSLEEDNINPFMPYKSDRIRQEHLEMLNSSIVGLKGERELVGLNEVESDENGLIRNGRNEQMPSMGMIGIRKEVAVTQKYLEGGKVGDMLIEQEKEEK